MDSHLHQLQTLSIKAISKVDGGLSVELSTIHDMFNQTLSYAPIQVQEHFSNRMCDVLISFIHNILNLVK